MQFRLTSRNFSKSGLQPKPFCKYAARIFLLLFLNILATWKMNYTIAAPAITANGTTKVVSAVVSCKIMSLNVSTPEILCGLLQRSQHAQHIQLGWGTKVKIPLWLIQCMDNVRAGLVDIRFAIATLILSLFRRFVCTSPCEPMKLRMQRKKRKKYVEICSCSKWKSAKNHECVCINRPHSCFWSGCLVVQDDYKRHTITERNMYNVYVCMLRATRDMHATHIRMALKQCVNGWDIRRILLNAWIWYSSW